MSKRAHALWILVVPFLFFSAAFADTKDDDWDTCVQACEIACNGINNACYGTCRLICTGGWIADKAACYLPFLLYVPVMADAAPVYRPDGVLTLTAARSNGEVLLSGQGSVADVRFYAATLEGHNLTANAAGQFFNVPWTLLGSGVFNPETDTWDLEADGATLPNANGYVLRAEFIDPSIPAPPPAFATPGDAAGAINALGFAFRLGTPTHLDTFDGSTLNLSQETVGSTFAFENDIAVVGGQREATLEMTGTFGDPITLFVAAGALHQVQGQEAFGRSKIIWDGMDGSQTEDPNGLQNLDLTMNGANAFEIAIDSFRFLDFNSDEVRLWIWIVLAGITGEHVHVDLLRFRETRDFPHRLIVPFYLFGVDMSNIGAAGFEIDGTVQGDFELIIDRVSTIHVDTFPPFVDQFNTGSLSLTQTAVGSTFNWDNDTVILGGERDSTIEVTANTGPGEALTIDVAGGVLTHRQGLGVFGKSNVIWDGMDEDNFVDPNGLRNLDLTAGFANAFEISIDRFEFFDFNSDEVSFGIWFTITSGITPVTVHLELFQFRETRLNPHKLIVPFESLGVDMTDVGALGFDIDGTLQDNFQLIIDEVMVVRAEVFPPFIDAFTSSSLSLSTSAVGDLWLTEIDTAVLGGERDVSIDVTGSNGNALDLTVGGGVLGHTQGVDVFGSSMVIYDGVDEDILADPNGLGNRNFIAQGVNAFEVNIESFELFDFDNNHVKFGIWIVLAGITGEHVHYEFDFLASLQGPATFVIPFSRFHGADFTNIGAAGFEIDGTRQDDFQMIVDHFGTTLADCTPGCDPAFDPDFDCDGFCASVDCDDSDFRVNPGAPENCGNLKDDNCDALIDANDAQCPAGCPDVDGDGLADAGCGGLDCNDSNGLDFRIPLEVVDLRMTSDGTGMVWAQNVGDEGANYTLMRSGDPADFSAPELCLEATDSSASDTTIPLLGELSTYVIVPHNSCGHGSAGNGTAGPRVAGCF